MFVACLVFHVLVVSCLALSCYLVLSFLVSIPQPLFFEKFPKDDRTMLLIVSVVKLILQA